MEKDSGSSIAWFLAGAAAGAAIALLYAPKTGKDTRKLIHKTTRDGRKAVEGVRRKCRQLVGAAGALRSRPSSH